MKKYITIIAAFAFALGASAQSTFPERIVSDALRSAEWTARSEASMAASRAVSSVFRDAERNSRKSSSKNTWECPHCHTQNKGNYCTECGNRRPQEPSSNWTCPVCGRRNSGGKYCSHCGNPREQKKLTPVKTIERTPSALPQGQRTITLEQLSQMSKSNNL